MSLVGRRGIALSLALCVNACGGGGSAPTVVPVTTVSAPVVSPPVVTPPAVAPPVVTPPPAAAPVPTPAAGPPDGLVLIAAGIDSLTAGSGDTWRKFFVEKVRGRYGDGGPGYAAFTPTAASDQGATLTLTGLTDFNIDSADGKLSVDGLGASTAAGGGTAAMTWLPPGKWAQARIYFLKQPGGGTMRCGNKSDAAAVLPTIDTAAAGLGLGHVDVAVGTGVEGRNFGCSNITGKVTLFGALVTLKPGLAMASWAVVGRSLLQVAAQDSALRRAWFAELKPHSYFINAGTNDDYYDGPVFDRYLRTVIGDIRAASPSTRVYIVQPNETFISRDPNSRFFPFAASRVAVATDFLTGYIDNRIVLGSYEQALAAGYMADNTHLNAAGQRLVGLYAAKQSGLETDLPDPGATPY